MQKTIYVVLPAYNEEGRIEDVILNIKRAGHKNIIVVNDGSEDNTALEAKRAGAEVVEHSINCGVGAAVQTGFEVALRKGADIIVLMDSDGQHDAKDLDAMTAPLLDNEVDVVLGSRFLQKNKIPFIRRVFNFIGNFVTFCISLVWVSDSQSGFRAFSKYAAQRVEIHANGYEFCSEIIWKMGEHKLRYCEVPIRVYYTKESMAKGQNFATGVKTATKLMIRSLMR